jgi:hypothetical protein
MGKISKTTCSVGPKSKPCAITTAKANPVKKSTKTFSTGHSTKPAK